MNYLKTFPLLTGCLFFLSCNEESGSEASSGNGSGTAEISRSSRTKLDISRDGFTNYTLPSRVLEIGARFASLKDEVSGNQITPSDFRKDWHEAIAEIKQLSSDELLALLENESQKQTPDSDLIRIIHVGLSKFQPQRCLDFFISESSKSSKSKSYYGALEVIAEQLQGQMITSVIEGSTSSIKYHFGTSVLKALLSVNSTLGKTFALEIDNQSGGNKYLSQYFRYKSLEDFDGALREIDSEGVQERGDFLVSVARYAIRNNPEDAIRALKLAGRHPAKISMIQEAYQRILSLSPESAADYLVKEDQVTLTNLFKNGKLANQIAQLGLGKTAEILSRLPYLESNSEGFQNAALALVRKEPSKVMAWVESFPLGPSRGEILESSMNAFAFDDPVAAKEYFEGSEDANQNLMIGGLLKGWSLKGPDSPKEGLDWLKNQSLPDLRKSELASESMNLASQKYPQSVVEILSDRDAVALISESPGALEGVYQSVGDSFSRGDPEAGTAWVESLPSPESAASRAGFESFFRGWLGNDTEAAVSWSETLKSTVLREARNQILDQELGGE